MHSAVLLKNVIEMLSIVLDVVVGEDSLEELESVVVRVSISGSIEEDTDVRVDHLIISDHEKGRVVDSSLGVGNSSVGSLGKG